jgi:uncharacterized membrane protein
MHKMNKQKLRNFGLTIGSIVAILFGLLFPWLFNNSSPTWPWVIAATLWIWALILPATLEPIYHGWMKVGYTLGWINTRIILGIMFYTLFFLVGLLMKAISYDPMSRKIDKSIASYRVTSRPRSREHVERPF